MVRVGDGEAIWHPSFRLVLATKLAVSELPADLLGATTVVNFRVTPQSLQEQLLLQILSHEEPELDRQRAELVAQDARDLALKHSIEEKILRVKFAKSEAAPSLSRGNRQRLLALSVQGVRLLCGVCAAPRRRRRGHSGRRLSGGSVGRVHRHEGGFVRTHRRNAEDGSRLEGNAEAVRAAG